jgi:hypothetical protein
MGEHGVSGRQVENVEIGIDDLHEQSLSLHI